MHGNKTKQAPLITEPPTTIFTTYLTSIHIRKNQSEYSYSYLYLPFLSPQIYLYLCSPFLSTQIYSYSSQTQKPNILLFVKVYTTSTKYHKLHTMAYICNIFPTFYSFYIVRNHQDGYPYLNLSLFFVVENIEKRKFFG